MKLMSRIVFIIAFALSSTALLAGGIKTSTANSWLYTSDFGKSCDHQSAVRTVTKHHLLGSSYHYDVWGYSCLEDIDTLHKAHVYYRDIPHLYINKDHKISIRAH